MRKSFLFMALVLVTTLGAADPYVILRRHYDALGGRELLEQEESTYLEGEIMVSNMAAPGTVKIWEQGDCMRRDIDFGFFRQLTGCDGVTSWSVDPGGHVQTSPFEKTRDINDAMSEFEHFNPDSDEVEVEWLGETKLVVGDQSWNCHIIEVRFKEGVGSQTLYIDDQDWMRRKSDLVTEDLTAVTTYFDWREADGIMRSFEQQTTIPAMNYHTLLKLDKFETNPEIDPALFTPPASEGDVELADEDAGREIPIEFDGQHLHVEVEIEGETYLFTLDTGATTTVIDGGLANKLGLETIAEVPGMGAAGEMTIRLVQLPPFKLHGLEFDSRQVAALDEYTDMMHNTKNERVSGILGYDFFSQFVVRVDYAAETVQLFDPKKFEYTGDGAVVEAQVTGESMYVPFTVDGVEGTWHLDLGAGMSSFHYNYAKEHGYDQREGLEFMAVSPGGEFKTREIPMGEMSLGGYAVNEKSMGVHIVNEGALARENIAGNLGSNVFRYFVLYIDFNNGRLIVEPGADYEKEYPCTGLGLQVWVDDDGSYYVKYASENAPGYEAGVRTGDRLLLVDGQSIDELGGMKAYRELSRADVGTVYTFTLERDGKQYECDITLRELF